MIDVVEIAKGFFDYIEPCEKYSKEKILELGMKDKFSEEAIEEGLNKIIVAALNLIRYTLRSADSIDRFVLVIPKIRENVFNPVKQKTARKITDSYHNIQDFINKALQNNLITQEMVAGIGK